MTRNLAETLGGATPEQWAADFLRVAGFPLTPANVLVVVSWEYAESAGGGGMFNPLNTTQGGYVGETDFNSVGVKNYASYADGVAANARVIHNGYYRDAVTLFERGDDAPATAAAITASPWGTGPITLRGTSSTPAPKPKEATMLIASPHKPKLTGRTAAAVWDAEHPNRVLLTNGASIAHDVPDGNGRRTWAPHLPPGAHGIGIMASIGKDGRPDGRGIVFQDDRGDTYDGRWS